MTGKITERAMLADLSISVWSARKFDKKATKEIIDSHSVTNDKALRTTKNLLPEHNETYKAITTAANVARQKFRDNTLPWRNDGVRILPAMNYLDFGKLMREAELNFKNAVPPFLEQYAFLRTHARTVLKDLYREEDYPDRHELREKFAFDIKFFPLPEASDFRVDLQEDDVKQIRQQIASSVEATIQSAMDEPYRRLFDGVAHMAARLSGAKTCACRQCKGKSYETDQFGDSLVDNLIGLVEVLPRLNLTGDEALTEAIEEVKTGLIQFSPDTIRASEPIRKTLAERAAEIQRNLAGYMGAAA